MALSPKPQWMLEEEGRESGFKNTAQLPLLAQLAKSAYNEGTLGGRVAGGGYSALQKASEILPMLLMGTPAGVMGQGTTALPYQKPKVMPKPFPETLGGTIPAIEFYYYYKRHPKLKEMALDWAKKQHKKYQAAYESVQNEQLPIREKLQKQIDVGSTKQFWREAEEMLDGRGDYILQFFDKNKLPFPVD